MGGASVSGYLTFTPLLKWLNSTCTTILPEIHSRKRPDPVKDTFFSSRGALVRELPLYYNFRISLTFYICNKFSLNEAQSNLCATTQLKWALPNKRSLIQHTKYYPVKALVVGTSCKRTHLHPVNDRDHFLRWQSDWEFSMMQWSDLCVPCMS